MMDDRSLDAFARAVGRRGLLAGAMALLPLAAWGVAEADPVSCPRRQPGESCRKGSDCCSGRCKRKRGRRKGKCRCGALLTPCTNNFDCCGDITGLAGSIVCTDKVGFDQFIVCCVSFTGPCESSDDCCEELVCTNGKCAEP